MQHELARSFSLVTYITKNNGIAQAISRIIIKSAATMLPVPIYPQGNCTISTPVGVVKNAIKAKIIENTATAFASPSACFVIEQLAANAKSATRISTSKIKFDVQKQAIEISSAQINFATGFIR